MELGIWKFIVRTGKLDADAPRNKSGSNIDIAPVGGILKRKKILIMNFPGRLISQNQIGEQTKIVIGRASDR